jgi:hypothetical protein
MDNAKQIITRDNRQHQLDQMLRERREGRREMTPLRHERIAKLYQRYYAWLNGVVFGQVSVYTD